MKKLIAKIKKWINKYFGKDDPVEQEIFVDKWLGANYQGAEVTLELRNAYISNGSIYVDYDKYNWPASLSFTEGGLLYSLVAAITGAEGDHAIPYDKDLADYDKQQLRDASVNAIACFFYRGKDGKITGGKFDWIRTGGQSRKQTKNIENGYGGHIMPDIGTECWYMWAKIDGSERSNFCEVDWR